MRIHLNKPGIRILGIAESFGPRQAKSFLAGVVMRRDLIIDGLSICRTSVGGDDATDSVVSLYRRFRRNDVNLIMISGAILSLYNIIDVDEVSRRTKLPVACITYKDTVGIEESIRKRFPDNANQKLAAYHRLGARHRVKLATGHTLYVRTSGIDLGDTKSLLEMFTKQGSLPEPIRVARILARAARAMHA